MTAFGHLHDDFLPPPRLSQQRGNVVAQVQRTIPNDHYAEGAQALREAGYDIAAGEFSVEEQYARAIDAARQAIYIENPRRSAHCRCWSG